MKKRLEEGLEVNIQMGSPKATHKEITNRKLQTMLPYMDSSFWNSRPSSETV